MENTFETLNDFEILQLKFGSSVSSFKKTMEQELCSLICELLQNHSDLIPKCDRILWDQIDDGVESVILNTELILDGESIQIETDSFGYDFIEQFTDFLNNNIETLEYLFGKNVKVIMTENDIDVIDLCDLYDFDED